MQNLKIRNIHILADRCSGRTIKSIADEHGISPDWVRCIIADLVRKVKSYDAVIGRMRKKISDLESEVRMLRLANPDGQSIDLCEFSTRTENVLRAHGINTIEQLSALEKSALLSMPNMGRKSVAEVMESAYYQRR